MLQLHCHGYTVTDVCDRSLRSNHGEKEHSMKRLVLFILVSFMTGGLLAQTPPQTPAAAPPPAATHPPMHDHMMAMHHDMQSMQDQATKMRATLEKLKANLAKITDPTAKRQAQLDVELWEEMVQHIEGMAKMMKAHEGMGDMKAHPSMPEEKPQPEKK